MPRVPPKVRLALLLSGLVVCFLVFAVWQPIGKEALRDQIESFGVVAPIAYVVLAVVLASLLVPGSLLATVGGVLFGTTIGFVCAITGSVCTTLVACTIGRRLGQEGYDEVAGRRLQAIGAWLERHGLLAVITARLAPGPPDAPISYAAGLTRIPLRTMALGTLIGAAPRGFAYAGFGDNLDRVFAGDLSLLTDPETLAAFVVFMASGLIGAGLVARAIRQDRSAATALVKPDDAAAAGSEPPVGAADRTRTGSQLDGRAAAQGEHWTP